MLYNVSATFFNYDAKDNKTYRTEMLVIGEDNARTVGAMYAHADNVKQVDVIDAFTGEVIESWCEE